MKRQNVDARKFIQIFEQSDFMGHLTRDDAERSGLGRIALAMRPAIAATEEPKLEGEIPVVPDVHTNCDHCGHRIQTEGEMTRTEVEGKKSLHTECAKTLGLKEADGDVQSMLAHAKEYPGQIIPPGGQPDERSAAALGTQDGSKAVHNQEDAYAKGGKTLGMDIPADRRGSYAPTTNSYRGSAPDTPDIASLGDPQVKRIFIESHESYVDALSSFVKLGLTLEEATHLLESDEQLTETIRKVMVRQIEETRRLKVNLGVSAAKKRRTIKEGGDEPLQADIDKWMNPAAK